MKSPLLAVALVAMMFCCAATTPVGANPYGDFNGDGVADMNDLPMFFDLWLVTDCGLTPGFDLDSDCTVTFHEFSALASNWRYEPVGRPRDLMTPPMAQSDSAITLIWSKPADYSNVAGYNIYMDGMFLSATTKLSCDVTGLDPNAAYLFAVRAFDGIGNESVVSNICSAATLPAPAVLYPEDYGAAADGITKDTAAIQAAIEACTVGGIVHLRTGKTFLSGGLFLKSNMTLQIDGTLKGTSDAADYPQIMTRFEGTEQLGYSSLINIGSTLNHTYGGTIDHVRICGSGTVSGGGAALAAAEGGGKMRGRLIYVVNASEVCIQGLSLDSPPAWTVHLLYSTNITVQGLTVSTTDIGNGDGCNPDSSTNIYIFNNTFDTGDDCIAIKSGKNLEGYTIGMPSSNIRVTNCTFLHGHGSVTIGSESSGGVNHVFAQDCVVQGNQIGLRMKTNVDRGGVVEFIEIRDWVISGCTISAINIITNYSSNPGGEPAPEYPVCRNITVVNVIVDATNYRGFVITGESRIHITDMLFENCAFYGTRLNSLSYVDRATFTGCTITAGFSQSNCTDIIVN